MSVRKDVLDEVVAVLTRERDKHNRDESHVERMEHDLIDDLMRRVVLDVGGKDTCVHPELDGPCSGCVVTP